MASNVVIRAEGLGKRYQIGAARQRHASIREAVAHAAGAPARKLRALGQPSGVRASSAEHVWVLKDVSFDVAQGEVLGVVGRNGAGKSTLLKILSRITDPTAGRVRLNGRVGALLEVGTGFHPELTGRENVFLNGSILGMDRAYIHRFFDEIVEFSGVGAFIDTPVKRYSSGMYLRLAFAVAAHLEPEILIVDEVLAVGDAEFQKKCMGKMGSVAREGRTVLLVSHNMAAVANLCTRAILLKRGRIERDGAVTDVIHHYLQSSRTEEGTGRLVGSDRRGNGRVQFSSVRFEDDRGDELPHGVSGQPLAIVLDYRSELSGTLPNCRVSVAVSDAVGQILFLCSSELTSRESMNLPPNGTLRCHIPALPLSQGEYHLTAFLEVNREVEDWIEGAAVMDVVDGDFFGTGRVYPAGWQGKGVLVSHSWSAAGA